MFGGIWLGAHRPSAGAPATYEQIITDSLDDGREVLIAAGWVTAPAGQVYIRDSDGGGGGRDVADSIAGWSFPAVGFSTCSLAMLRLTVVVETVVGTFRVYGEKNPSVGSTQYSASNFPSSHFADATTPTGHISTAAAEYNIDVTTIVNEIMGSAAYTGGRINFWAEASSAFADCRFATTNAADSARPRLQITA